jgi:succinate-semialdehyde dehydrogenase / glutarate-semialdehyde dehydrogenase
MQSINPATGTTLKQYTPWNDGELEQTLAASARAAPGWRATPLVERTAVLAAAARELRANIDNYARLISDEMGKLIGEARAEIEKSALGCEHYANTAESYLRSDDIPTHARRSYVAYEPLGAVLAIMPWNFPFWQVFRFAAPALVAGNVAVLKHASNVTGCALAIEEIWRKAGLPDGAFRTLLIDTDTVSRVIADQRIRAVTLTGSDGAGRAVASTAGRHLKKTVLELGGSDAFVVLEDADLDQAAKVGAAARLQNAGQSCIAAKRFVLVESIADDFLDRFAAEFQRFQPGDPLDPQTTLAPLARANLRDQLHAQVERSIGKGARALLGCAPLPGAGFYYAPSILDSVTPGMPAYEEELFGPVAVILRARDEADALRLANDSRFGLGASVWTCDIARGERFARGLEAGSCFVNAMVKSDPRVPFGGVKDSGYGRELSVHGLREFTNVKTVWIG